MDQNKGDQGSGLDPKFILSEIRKGYKQELSFQFGEYPCPCRILSAEEETLAISRGKLAAKKTSKNVDGKLLEPIKVQKEVLFSGTTIGLEHYLPRETLDKLSADELAKAYDKYRSAVVLADPDFELLPIDQIDEMISRVKKKQATWKDFYISDLAAMGRYFLDRISPKDSEPGS